MVYVHVLRLTFPTFYSVLMCYIYQYMKVYNICKFYCFSCRIFNVAGYLGIDITFTGLGHWLSVQTMFQFNSFHFILLYHY